MFFISSFSSDMLMQTRKGMFAYPADAFTHYLNKGMEYSDVIASFFDIYPFDEYMKYYALSGLKPGSLIASENYIAKDPDQRQKNLSSLIGYLERISDYGISDVMLSTASEPAQNEEELLVMREMMVEGLSVLTEHAKKNGVRIAIENRSSLKRPDSRLSDVLYILNSVTDLDFVFDMGNSFIIGEDALKMYDTLKYRITHCHCKDWIISDESPIKKEDGTSCDGCVLGEGLVQLSDILKRMKNDNFNGRLSIEISTYLRTVSISEIEKSIDFLNSI